MDHRNVNIIVPTASMFSRAPGFGAAPPTPEELIQAQEVELRFLRSEVEKLHINAGTIANSTVCLVYMLADERGDSYDEITIPSSMRHKLDGAQIQLRIEPNNDIVVSYVTANDVVYDGRVA